MSIFLETWKKRYFKISTSPLSEKTNVRVWHFVHSYLNTLGMCWVNENTILITCIYILGPSRKTGFESYCCSRLKCFFHGVEWLFRLIIWLSTQIHVLRRYSEGLSSVSIIVHGLSLLELTILITLIFY